jgi:hypothetical protein
MYGLKRTKRKIWLWLLPAVAAALVCCIWAYLLRGSRRIRAERDILPDEMVFYNQLDGRWKEDRLGASGYDMESSGCLTTCIAMITGLQDVPQSFDPGELNALFSDEQCYDAEGNLQWGEVERALSVTAVRRGPMEGRELEELLLEGVYPIVRVRMHGLGAYHYVLLVGSCDGEFLCIDPLNREKKPLGLSGFGNRIYAVRYLEEGKGR